ncbi:MAG: site-specific DNA-methyltransferase [Colwellia sp.]|nr:site-specific DNA-methyltransferase [Colwellia sp.]
MMGDCLERMKEIPDGSVDAILTDPPYGTTACKWDSVIPFEPMWEQLNRVIKPNGAIVLFGSEPFSSALRMSNIKNYKYDWVWQKNNAGNFQIAKHQPLKKHEIISVFNAKNVYKPQGLKDCNIIQSNKNKAGKLGHLGSEKLREKYVQKKTGYPDANLIFKRPNKPKHPTQKPLALMAYLLRTYTNENETVLDFTMGSGTTGVAAKSLNRKFIGIELDEGYFNIAKERINKN